MWPRRRQHHLGGGWIVVGGSADVEPEPPRPWNDPGWQPPEDIDDTPEVVVLSPDYGAELPLWGCNWWNLGLSGNLLNALADWQQQFDEHYRHDSGWTEQTTADEWAARGDELGDALRAALPPTVALRVRLWPVEQDGIFRRAWLRLRG